MIQSTGSTVELADVRVFLALCDELHFGRTAQRLHLTQSRVSKTIAALERNLGGRLFDRSSRRVALTPLGERFREEVAPPYASLLAAVNRTRRAVPQHRSTARIGAAGSTMPALPALVAMAQCAQEDLEYQYMELPWSQRDPHDDRDGTVDVLAMFRTDKLTDLTEGPVIARQGRAALVGSNHRLADRRSIRLAEIDVWGINQVMRCPHMGDAVFPEAAFPPGLAYRRKPFTANGYNDLAAAL
ncbi:MAG TPA: LysR family transcriptional regulator [Actinocrinis sp.]|jgi:DNA-binding transcriptional LysR family regulator